MAEYTRKLIEKCGPSIEKCVLKDSSKTNT
jgi:hypothetical protein